jgi:hypothetical protein
MLDGPAVRSGKNSDVFAPRNPARALLPLRRDDTVPDLARTGPIGREEC